jgi:hypothetical protein
MTKITLKGWKPGLRKISLTRLLQEYAELSLIDARGIVDRLLEGEHVTIIISSRIAAEAFIQRAVEIGAMAELEN